MADWTFYVYLLILLVTLAAAVYQVLKGRHMVPSVILIIVVLTAPLSVVMLWMDKPYEAGFILFMMNGIENFDLLSLYVGFIHIFLFVWWIGILWRK
ncbi:hypothetical protein [Alkalicoccus chagannorensis]|uniref:hypothetical protein n=1 Tax=Alkalicoccus chagannorensis TaxID=427072 RepID=UPI0003FA11BF|nr:hypothetical protein [Alkalicoccus chagannorensis]